MVAAPHALLGGALVLFVAGAGYHFVGRERRQACIGVLFAVVPLAALLGAYTSVDSLLLGGTALAASLTGGVLLLSGPE